MLKMYSYLEADQAPHKLLIKVSCFLVPSIYLDKFKFTQKTQPTNPLSYESQLRKYYLTNNKFTLYNYNPFTQNTVQLKKGHVLNLSMAAHQATDPKDEVYSQDLENY